MQCDFWRSVAPSSSMSASTMPLSSGSLSTGMLVQYKRFLFWAETRLLLISIGSTLRNLVMMSCDSFFILTFSSKKYLGFSALSNRTYSKNKVDLGSSKLSCLPAKLKPWQGDPPMSRSMSYRSPTPFSFMACSALCFVRTSRTSPRCTMSG